MTYAHPRHFGRCHSGFFAMSGRGRGRHGYGSWGAPDFWAAGFGGGGRKARRGDVRAAILVLLDEEPRNGYQLMQEIEQRSDGAWRPSPGSIYPALQQLEDEGLVAPRDGEGRRLLELTDEGRAYVEENRDELGTPWEAFTGDSHDEYRETGRAIKDVALAAAQVLRSGDQAQVEQARKVLSEARRSLYLILAEDEDA